MEGHAGEEEEEEGALLEKKKKKSIFIRIINQNWVSACGEGR